MSTRFATTQWSQVLTARDGTGAEAVAALEALCRAYWYPIYAFVRRQGSDAEEAKDLTQGYFAYLLDKSVLESVDPAAGRFRSFLLATLKHFLSHARERAAARKRGGGAQILSLDVATAEERYGYEPHEPVTPEELFERRWALTVVERALGRLEAESEARGATERYRELRCYPTGEEPRLRYRQAAAKLGMSEPAVRGAVHRMRRRFGAHLRDEIAQTVADLEEVDEELRHLLAVIATPRGGPV